MATMLHPKKFIHHPESCSPPQVLCLINPTIALSLCAHILPTENALCSLRIIGQLEFKSEFKVQWGELCIPSGATKVLSSQLILVHSVSQISSDLNSELPTMLRRLLKDFLNFTVPWFQYQSPSSSKFLFGYGWKGFASKLIPI